MRHERQNQSRVLSLVGAESDHEIIARLARGDRTALAPLYAGHAATLVRVATAILRSRSDAEDAVHDVFLTVDARASQYRSALGSVRTWLSAAVRNACIDRLRRRARRVRVLATLSSAPRWDATSESTCLRAIDGARALAGVASLPAIYRDTLEELFVSDLTCNEVSLRQNVPIGTVKSRAARALGALRTNATPAARAVKAA